MLLHRKDHPIAMTIDFTDRRMRYVGDVFFGNQIGRHGDNGNGILVESISLGYGFTLGKRNTFII